MRVTPTSVSQGTMHKFLECTVAQYMNTAVRTVTLETTLRELEALFERYDFNAFPVVEGGAMLGVVTKFDFIRIFAFSPGQMLPHYDELMSRTVKEIMGTKVVGVGPTEPLTRVLQKMVEIGNRSFPVVDADHRLIGMISREDIMRALIETTARQRVEQSSDH